MYTYAPHAFETDDVLDVRRINDVFFGLADAIGGGLGEQVFDAEFITDADYCAVGFFGRYWSVVDETDPQAPTPALRYAKTWEATRFTTTVDSRGGTFVIDASFQVSNAARVTSVGSSSGSITFAIRVDGAVQGETIIGTGDYGADKQTDKYGVRYEMDANGLPVPKYYGGTGPAIRAVQTPVATGCALRLAPGRHTIELVYRNPIFGIEEDQFVMNGELYAMELPA